MQPNTIKVVDIPIYFGDKLLKMPVLCILGP